jgi:hypothetical protein
MNVISYIKRHGDIPFKKEPLNEIDKLIFALLSYIDYAGIFNGKNKKTIQDIATIYFSNHHKEKNIIAIKNSIRILKIIKDETRYKDLLLYNYVYIGNNTQQFSAISIEINPSLVYVSFEGTDHLISGWEEDFKMGYKFPVKAQKRAIKYINKYFRFKDCNLIIGGHSKGGNLALVSSMYCKKQVRDKIMNVYSYDGPGLRTIEYNSKRYENIKNKYKLIVPNYSIVGLILKNSNNYTTIKSNSIGLMAHNTFTWQIIGNTFIKTKISTFSDILDKGIDEWIEMYNKKQKKKFVKEIFNVFKRTNITSLIDIMNNYKLLIKILREIKQVDNEVAKMLKEFIAILIRANKEKLIFFNKKKL